MTKKKDGEKKGAPIESRPPLTGTPARGTLAIPGQGRRAKLKPEAYAANVPFLEPADHEDTDEHEAPRRGRRLWKRVLAAAGVVLGVAWLRRRLGRTT